MIILYLGSVRLKGTSRKTGNDYDFIQFHYAKDNPRFVGRESCIKSLDPKRVNIESMVPNSYYDADCDDQGNFLAFHPVKV